MFVLFEMFSSRRTNKVDDGFSSKRCLSWFKQYTTADEPDVLGPDAMEQFCKDIGVEPEDVVMLGELIFSFSFSADAHWHFSMFTSSHRFVVFFLLTVIAYKMNARQMGFFTQSEWQKGLTDLQCDSAIKLQYKLDSLRSSLNDQNVFKNVYRYAYDFARVSSISQKRRKWTHASLFIIWIRCESSIDSVDVLTMCYECVLIYIQNEQDKDQRSMDIETAKAMLHLLLSKQWQMYPEFAQFLQQSKYKVINKDQWCNILEFSKTIIQDLSNYDVDGACK